MRPNARGFLENRAQRTIAYCDAFHPLEGRKAMSWFAAFQALFLLYAGSKIATTVGTNGLQDSHHIVSGHGCIRSGNGRVPQPNPWIWTGHFASLRCWVSSGLTENDWASTFFFQFLSDFDTQLTRQSRSFIFEWTKMRVIFKKFQCLTLKVTQKTRPVTFSYFDWAHFLWISRFAVLCILVLIW